MDARASIEIIKQIKPVDYLIVDHYALDDRWEKRLKPHVGRLIVVDDLADRPHCADILVDQNYGRQQQHYANLVRDCCKVLAGAQFALLRPQFADNRQQALSRRRRVGGNKLVLVFLGVVLRIWRLKTWRTLYAGRSPRIYLR